MRLNKSFSILSISVLLASAVTMAANPAQAAKLTTVDFDEVNVGLEGEDNPLYGGQKIDNLWADYGLNMSSSVNELWLYDSTTKGGHDDDLLTGKGEYKHNGKTIKYETPEQGNVLIIQEKLNQKNQSKISNLERDIKKLNNKIPNINNRNKRNRKIRERDRKIQERDNLLRPDDNIGGTMKFGFTDELGVLFDSIGVLDFDEPKLGQIEFSVKFFGDKELTKFGVGSDLVKSVEILSTDGNGNKIKNDNSLRKYDFDFSDRRITEFNLKLPGSGAITDLNYYRGNKKKFARKVNEPGSILGLVAISGLAASYLKRKRKSSDNELIK